MVCLCQPGTTSNTKCLLDWNWNGSFIICRLHGRYALRCWWFLLPYGLHSMCCRFMDWMSDGFHHSFFTIFFVNVSWEMFIIQSKNLKSLLHNFMNFFSNWIEGEHEHSARWLSWRNTWVKSLTIAIFRPPFSTHLEKYRSMIWSYAYCLLRSFPRLFQATMPTLPFF